jgi:hypothetical protein
MTLDEVLAAVELRPAAPKNIRGLKADPPAIFISTRPAALVNIDGSPIWHLLGKGPLQYAVNTNWDLIRDPSSAAYFLRDGRSWLTSSTVPDRGRDHGRCPRASTICLASRAGSRRTPPCLRPQRRRRARGPCSSAASPPN